MTFTPKIEKSKQNTQQKKEFDAQLSLIADRKRNTQQKIIESNFKLTAQLFFHKETNSNNNNKSCVATQTNWQQIRTKNNKKKKHTNGRIGTYEQRLMIEDCSQQ